MIGETSVYFGEKKVVFAGQFRCELFNHPSGGTVARVPSDPKSARIKALEEAFDIGVFNNNVGHRLEKVECLPASQQTIAWDQSHEKWT